MTRSVQTKLVLILVILTVVTMLTVGTIMVNRVAYFYNNDFEKQISAFFDDNIISELTGAAKNADAPAKMSKILEAYSGVLGIDTYRNYYILSETGSYLAGSNTMLGSVLDKSENMILAMSGKMGNGSDFPSEYMDYALPITVDDEVQYIVYLKDTKEEMHDLNWILISIIVETLFLGLLVAVMLSFALSKTITNPIENITTGAKKISDGDFSYHIAVRSKDEIGTLSETFNSMASVLKSTLDDIDGERNKLKTIFLYLTDGVAAFDREAKLLHFNRTAEQMLGAKWQEGENTFQDVFEQIEIADTFEAAKTLQGGKYLILERSINEKVLRLHIASFQIGTGEQSESSGVIVVIHDITEQQQLEKARREFIANVSHELRTPLTNIKSYTETVLDDKEISREMTEKFLHIVEGETDRMIRIVKDLTVLSRLDNNKMDWNKETFSAAELVERICDSMALEAKGRGQVLTKTIDPSVDKMTGDRAKIEQVLINVVSNAIKYTPDGGKVEVDATVHRGKIYIKVSDSGIGIAKKDLKRVFERFYRVDKARSREMGGTGLGLAIAKEIVEAHHGKIAITSDEGKGTQVIIQLPLEFKAENEQI